MKVIAELLSKHWHGLSQAAYPFSDGTPLASQWPIPAKHFFDHELQLIKNSAGTYFYHSHVGIQAVSASGPLIIEECERPAPYKTDGERTIQLQELFNRTDASLEAGLVATPLNWTGETNGFLVNGKTISNYGIVDNSSKKLDVINVEPNQTYRFRFIAATALSYLSLGFESHTDLQIMEADGSYTKPHSTDLLQMGTGQRFSVLFKTKTCAELEKTGKLDYYMQVESRERPSNTTNYAVLRYHNTCKIQSVNRVSTTSYPAKKAIQLPPTINGLLDYVLEPLFPNNFPRASEVTRRVTINVQQTVNGYTIWQDSNITWTDVASNPIPHTTPAKPYLVALYENATAYLPDYSAAVANGGIDKVTKTFPARIGEVLEIVLQNIGSHTHDGSKGGSLDAHPWHAHGKHFYDIGSGPGAYDSAANEHRLNGTTPVQRDTTMLYRYNQTTQPDEKHGWRAWRLRVEEPGVRNHPTH